MISFVLGHVVERNEVRGFLKLDFRARSKEFSEEFGERGFVVGNILSRSRNETSISPEGRSVAIPDL
jgi:hypothetical protein